jgi:putative NADH-flavin reductase
MKPAIIGASRGVGHELLKLALQEGLEVTAMLRNPAKLKISDLRLKVIEGDILDPSAAHTVVTDQEAVCICVGIGPTRKPVDVFSRGTENVLSAIGQHGHQKLIVVTGIGAGDSKGHGGFLYDRIFNPLFLATIYADKDRQEALIKASGLQWLIVRPGALTHGPRTGTYRALTDLTGITAGRISRCDVADFILKQLATPTFFGKTPLLTY